VSDPDTWLVGTAYWGSSGTLTVIGVENSTIGAGTFGEAYIFACLTEGLLGELINSRLSLALDSIYSTASKLRFYPEGATPPAVEADTINIPLAVEAIPIPIETGWDVAESQPLVWAGTGWYYDGDNGGCSDCVRRIVPAGTWASLYAPTSVDITFVSPEDWESYGNLQVVVEGADSTCTHSITTPEALLVAGEHTITIDLTHDVTDSGATELTAPLSSITYLGMHLGRGSLSSGNEDRQFLITNVEFTPDTYSTPPAAPDPIVPSIGDDWASAGPLLLIGAGWYYDGTDTVNPGEVKSIEPTGGWGVGFNPTAVRIVFVTAEGWTGSRNLEIFIAGLGSSNYDYSVPMPLAYRARGVHEITLDLTDDTYLTDTYPLSGVISVGMLIGDGEGYAADRTFMITEIEFTPAPSIS
jgi:hypothetical protein